MGERRLTRKWATLVSVPGAESHACRCDLHPYTAPMHRPWGCAWLEGTLSSPPQLPVEGNAGDQGQTGLPKEGRIDIFPTDGEVACLALSGFLML